MHDYRDFVEAQSQRNPSIQNLVAFLARDRMESSSCRIATLEFSAYEDKPDFFHVDVHRLGSWLEIGPSEGEKKIQGRILIVEDLTRSVVETLGACLQIDPLFFASHLHSPWPDITVQTPDMANLPSRLKMDTYVNIHYHRTIAFKDPGIAMRQLLRTSNVHRKVVILPKTKNVLIGLAQHSCSMLRTSLPDGSWLCLVLVDPPITNTYYSVKERKEEVLHFDLQSTLFLGGYEDFLDPPHEKTCPPGPTRSGLLDDLAYYWSRQRPQFFDSASPSLIHLAYYPLRIVAGEWVSYLTVMHHSIKQYEYTISGLSQLLNELDRLNSDLRSLQSWRRRSMSSQQKLRLVVRFIRQSDGSSGFPGLLDLVAQDFDSLARSVEDFGQRFERVLPIVTSMVQIADSRQSFAETANVSRLTYLALVFVPLTFTTGLFSMNNDRAPGSRGFWQFFAVAIPDESLLPTMESTQASKIYYGESGEGGRPGSERGVSLVHISGERAHFFNHNEGQAKELTLVPLLKATVP
ncbi:Mg2+ transporter protein CorA-like/Zinc transport protein ZntB [Macrophomina phaseolina MS6]|uniref:Mg2+ transporter protein CorA-like/Zinc transport protein ZntB n=1 Tax=Macrophomina phaseolina (strain MS6) TaxID=1126212 RepID=K2SHK6_MACPH|nr:Mg2+ transporter protein CorA-like/Zinc transport protein ZntB [Macrophomina phaseolina MS6]